VRACVVQEHGERATALSVQKAKRLLDWEPREDWRQGRAGLREPEPVPAQAVVGAGGYEPAWRRRGYGYVQGGRKAGSKL
jgi:hypothetical protein